MQVNRNNPYLRFPSTIINLVYPMRSLCIISIIVLASLLIAPAYAQKKGEESITVRDLEMHMQFLASDELEGRNTGEPGLQIASRYLAVQAEHLGLEPADSEGSYFQYYTIVERTYDRGNSWISVSDGDSGQVALREPFYVLPAVDQDTFNIEGEVVFAGYGINEEDQGYNDFQNIDIEDKVILVMNRAPLNEEGTGTQWDNEKWNGFQNLRYKIPYIYSKGPRAVLLVLDPKSGYNSIEELNPDMATYLSLKQDLKQSGRDPGVQQGHPRTILIHRQVADRLLEGSGTTLEELQQEIDRELAPRSFFLEGKHLSLHLQMQQTDMAVSNVFGLVEGTDPVLKDEVVIYMAHYDHLGTDREGRIFNGADDNASGTAALIEIAEAFIHGGKRPRRSIGFLWVSAEEIGLFGSRYYAEHPLIPLERTAAVINLDMVGRTRTGKDDTSDIPGLTITGGDTIKVIGGLQSSVLMQINRETLEEKGMTGNYEYNNTSHPERYFYRSDHISFARKDIPVLFYSTGTHADYHRVTDEEKLIDYDKFLKVTRFCYRAGFNVAQYKGPIEVDNPMSAW